MEAGSLIWPFSGLESEASPPSFSRCAVPSISSIDVPFMKWVIEKLKSVPSPDSQEFTRKSLTKLEPCLLPMRLTMRWLVTNPSQAEPCHSITRRPLTDEISDPSALPSIFIA